jgi:ABC-2 type transport system ATP-binding protein
MTPEPTTIATSAMTVRDLTRKFGAFVAVDRISFDVGRGEIFGFLGANGAGKSTTIRMLCGLLKPTSGAATVDGIDVGRDPEAVKRRIGYMSQKFSLYEALTVDQNIRFFGALYGLSDDQIADRRKFVIDMAGLAGREHSKARELAGGWRQRLALGCSILHEPKIVFLDEPTGGVDPVSRRQFWRLIEDLSRAGVTILVTTHHLDEAEHCHRIAIINAGKLSAIGTSRELKRIFADRAIVEIHSSRPVDVMKALEQLDEVQKTTVFGTAVHAVLRSGSGDVESLRERLRTTGLKVESIDRVMPSLEDVFLDVVENSDAGRQPREATSGPGL